MSNTAPLPVVQTGIPPKAAKPAISVVPEVPVPEKKAKKKPDMPIGSVTVSINYLDGEGKMQEVMHDIGGENVRIVQCIHNINQKVKMAKGDEGELLGFEPTGEYELTLKVKYIKE